MQVFFVCSGTYAAKHGQLVVQVINRLLVSQGRRYKGEGGRLKVEGLRFRVKGLRMMVNGLMKMV